MLSPSLKFYVTKQIYIPVIRQNKIFGPLENEQLSETLLSDIEQVSFQPEEDIVKQGDDADKFFLLSMGECQVLVKDETRKELPFKFIIPGSHFGEVGLITAGKRTATVRALNYCTCGQISAKAFYRLLKQYPMVLTALKERMHTYRDKMKLFQRKMLQ